MRKILTLNLIICLLLNACAPNQTKEKQEPKEKTAKTSRVENIMVYDKYPDFEYMLNKQDDTLHVVNFWATWCKPCVAELPYFERLVDEYADRKLKVTLVSLDDKRKLEKKVLPFVKKKQLKSELVLLDDSDYNSWIDKVSPEWSGAIPATYIYIKDNSIFKEEEFDYKSLKALVDTFEF